MNNPDSTWFDAEWACAKKTSAIISVFILQLFLEPGSTMYVLFLRLPCLIEWWVEAAGQPSSASVPPPVSGKSQSSAAPLHIKTSCCSERINHIWKHLKCMCAHAHVCALIGAIREFGEIDRGSEGRKISRGKRKQIKKRKLEEHPSSSTIRLFSRCLVFSSSPAPQFLISSFHHCL